jgi:hypothetical protein
MNKLILASVLAIGLLLGGAATASADPVTITLSPEQVQHLCEKRLPKIEKRITGLLDRINAGPEVRGSVEWLRTRATTERDAGRETTAQLLEERPTAEPGGSTSLTRSNSRSRTSAPSTASRNEPPGRSTGAVTRPAAGRRLPGRRRPHKPGRRAAGERHRVHVGRHRVRTGR